MRVCSLAQDGDITGDALLLSHIYIAIGIGYDASYHIERTSLYNKLFYRDLLQEQRQSVTLTTS